MQVGRELLQEEAWREEAAALGVPFDGSVLKPGGVLARHRVWQNSYFQRLLLGPDADKVRGPALLLTQTAELRAWKATEAADYMGPCLERAQRWAVRLQHRLQGLAEDTVEDPSAAAAPDRSIAAGLGGTAGKPTACTHLQRDILPQPVEQLEANNAAALHLQHQQKVTAADPRVISVHNNSLYQRSICQSPEQRQLPGQPTEVAEAEAKAAATAADTAPAAALSSATAGFAASHKQALLPSADDIGIAPSTLQLDPLATDTALQPAAAAAVVTAGGGNRGLETKPPSHLTADDLEAAAEAAAVAASQPGSPQSGSPSNPWDTAGATAAQLPAGSVPPAHAKLAYRALLDNKQQDNAAAAEGQSVDRPLSGGSASGRYGLAELVVEKSDAINSARSDINQPSSSRPLSSRQVQVQIQQEASAGSHVEYAESLEVVSPRRRRPRSRAGVGNGRERRPSAGISSKDASPAKHSAGKLLCSNDLRFLPTSMSHHHRAVL